MGTRITYIGHGTALIDADGTRLLTDPLLRDRFLFIRRRVAMPDPADYERIDAVLLSHLHPDHLDFGSLALIEKPFEVVAARGSARLLGRRGYQPIELSPGESAAVGTVTVTATWAEHDGRRFPIGPKIDALGYLVRAPSACVYFAGDTDLFEAMAELEGAVDVALLPIGGWGPKVGDGHLDPKRAAEAAAVIKPAVVIPIHWGAFLRADVFRLRPGLLTSYPRELAGELRRRAPSVELQALAPGEAFELERASSKPLPGGSDSRAS